MNLLANPLALRASVVFVLAMCGFALGIWVVRRLRRTIAAEADLESAAAPSLETLPLHLYNTVIQQLKQQKHELQMQSQTQQRRARTTENLSQAVLSNLSCGVLVFGSNGLVKQFNPAAKEILGFASPSGMCAEDILRGAIVNPFGGSEALAGGETASPAGLADEVHCILQGASKRRQAEADYTTPAGAKRRIAITISPVPAADGSLLGAACLINDISEFERIRQQQELHSEISAERALELRTSLTTISGYAQQLASTCEPELAKQLAADIASEAAQLDRSIGGFLTEKRSPGRVISRAAAVRS